ncbi:MAG: cupin-like domain-containing protein [Amphiplicatus sp.]
MKTAPVAVQAIERLSPEKFQADIISAGRPVVLKGLAADWPAVEAARRGDEALAQYMLRFDTGRPVQTMLGDPSIRGRFFYTDDLKSLNFVRRLIPIGQTVMRLLTLRQSDAPSACYIQSAPIPDFLPGFEVENRIDHAPPLVSPRIWIGNRLTVQTHFDLSENIACVVAGRRRFTLFPPEQLSNLYPGPFELTLAGPPVSMVHLDAPDTEKYPRFSEALAHAHVAELEPGDAIYIPYFWWHHVESLDPFNVLVNYWWSEAPPDLGSPFDCLLHGLLTLRDMPPRYREIWRMVFDHYVFKRNGEPVEHLPPDARGALGERDPKRIEHMRKMLAHALAREAGLVRPNRAD